MQVQKMVQMLVRHRFAPRRECDTHKPSSIVPVGNPGTHLTHQSVCLSPLERVTHGGFVSVMSGTKNISLSLDPLWCIRMVRGAIGWTVASIMRPLAEYKKETSRRVACGDMQYSKGRRDTHDAMKKVVI